jgi:hydroxyacid-oxoacid transhydrogenase
MRGLLATLKTYTHTTHTRFLNFSTKTGISNRALRPTLGLVDPDNTSSMPPEVAVASGFDVLCHALESYTILPFNQRSPRPTSPLLRPAYQGANPISDVWSTHALRILAKFFVRSVKDRGDREANAMMTLAASAAGVGFGNAGVHLCHGLSYGISGQNKGHVHPGYGGVEIIPHGIAVVLTAPAVFQFTAASNPMRHWEAAQMLEGEETPAQVYSYGIDGSADNRPCPVSGFDAGTSSSIFYIIYYYTYILRQRCFLRVLVVQVSVSQIVFVNTCRL